MDIRKLHQTFIDESLEMLSDLERGLLELEKNPEAEDTINTVFRAAHTIKGSSGSLGLPDISRFTHEMEEILDLVREKRQAADTGIVSMLLEGTDVIRDLVGSLATGEEYDTERYKHVFKKLEGFNLRHNIIEYRIKIKPSDDLLRRGIDPAMFLDDLRSIGEVTQLKCLSDAVPPVMELDPESLYLGWEMVLSTAKDDSEIRKIFEFIEQDSELLIERLSKEEISSTESEDTADTLPQTKRTDLNNGGNDQGRKARSRVSSVRVGLDKLDGLLNAVGEMAVLHSMFQQIMNMNGSRDIQSFGTIFTQLQGIGREIQERAMSLRMLPVGDVFHRFERTVRELSQKRNKEVKLIISGEDTELDKGMVEKITDPLVHLIRNALDHGIETNEERLKAGKPVIGTLHLKAYQAGDSIYIEVSDDGKGMDRDRILSKARDRGLVIEGDELTDEQVYSLVFTAGFSTAAEISEISGRGVGMDVVKKNIESLNGKVFVRSERGKGTSVTIRIPLTLAIIDGLTAQVGEEVFVIPVVSVIESLRPQRHEVRGIYEKGEVVDVRGEYIPLVRLHKELHVVPYTENPWEAIVIIVGSEGNKCCLLVDDILGEQQIVIKNLGKATPRVRDISGGTILGDGKVALVIDVQGIVETATKA